MKRYLILALVALAAGCGPSMEERLAVLHARESRAEENLRAEAATLAELQRWLDDARNTLQRTIDNDIEYGPDAESDARREELEGIIAKMKPGIAAQQLIVEDAQARLVAVKLEIDEVVQ